MANLTPRGTVGNTAPMRTSRALVLAAATTGTVMAGRRNLASRAARWDTNPDHCDGDPLRLPDGEDIAIEAPDGAILRGHRSGDPSGPTAVLVHGLIESVGFWAPVIRRLADAGLDVVAIDQRGHGESERGTAPYATATLGADLRTWVEQLDVDDVVVAGHSMGGVAAMAYAAEHAAFAAERTKHLVLVATLAHSAPLFGLPDVQIDIARAMRALDRAITRDVALHGLARIFGTWPTRGALEATRQGLLSTDKATRADAVQMLRSFDLRPGLGDIRVPTVVVAGSHDRLTPLAGNERIADLVPGARLEVLHGMGHMLTFEAPDAVADHIVQATKPTDS